MAHKTFISYKYSEARKLRDDIIDALGPNAQYYNGEDGFSDDMSSLKAETIRKRLSDMMYDTSVTIVIISPNMKLSKWIDWEIEYCLKNITRKDRTSQTNGVVGVIMKYNGGYDWLKKTHNNSDGCQSFSYDESKVYQIINNNRYNQNPKIYSCQICKTVDVMIGSYISYVEEETFLRNPQKYIDNAYNKSENNASGYDLTKQR